MKKLLALIIVTMLCITLFAGCTPGGASSDTPTTTSPTGDTTSTPAGEKLTFGVSLNNTDQYRTSWLEKFKAKAEAAGHKVIDTNADNDASKQLSDIDSLILQKPDVIFVHALNSEGIIPGVDAIKKANIGCITIDMPTESTKVDSHIMDFQGENGVIQAEYVKAWLAEDSSREMNIGYIIGDRNMEGAMPRMYDFFKTLDIKEKDAVTADAQWSAEKATGITEDWLQANPNINIFACMSDEIAMGCIQALKTAGKDMDKVLVLGVDGSDTGKVLLKNGELDCTAARDVDKEVQTALETGVKLAAGESVEKEIQPKAIYAMTKDNVDK